MITYHTGDGAVDWPVLHDPDEYTFYGLYYDAPVWQADSVVYANRTIVKPTVDNGHYYYPTTGGRTGHVEPTWTPDETEDGTFVVWKARPFDLQLFPGDDIDTSTWSCDVVGVTLDNAGYSNGIVKIRVTAVPAGTKKFTLTNRLAITRANGDQERRDRSIVITVGDT